MKATKAYIASLGTTGVLLAASLLMLAVVSAVVAFDRWPDGRVSSRVQTLVLAERPAPIRVTARAVVGAATAPARGGAPAAGTRATGVQRIAGERLTGIQTPARGRTTPPATPALPAPVQKSLQTVQDTTTPLIDAVSNPAGATSQVADGAQSVTDSAAVSLGKISPDLGNAVSGTGQAAADAVRTLPLPQHVIPGH